MPAKKQDSDSVIIKKNASAAVGASGKTTKNTKRTDNKIIIKKSTKTVKKIAGNEIDNTNVGVLSVDGKKKNGKIDNTDLVPSNNELMPDNSQQNSSQSQNIGQDQKSPVNDVINPDTVQTSDASQFAVDKPTWPTTPLNDKSVNNQEQNITKLPAWLSKGLVQPAISNQQSVDIPSQLNPQNNTTQIQGVPPVQPVQSVQSIISNQQPIINNQPATSNQQPIANSQQSNNNQQPVNIPSWLNSANQATQAPGAAPVMPIQPVSPVQRHPNPTAFKPNMPATMPPSAPQKPYKPMTLSDLATQTPIFSMEDLDFSKKRRRELREKKKMEEQQNQGSLATPVATSPAKDTAKPENIKPSITTTVPSTPEVKPEEKSPMVEQVVKPKIVEAEIVSKNENKIEAKYIPKVVTKDSKEEETDVSAWAELKEKLSETIKESNISKKQIFGCIAGIIFIVFLLFVIFRGIKWIFSGSLNLATKTNQETQVSDQIKTSMDQEPQSSAPQNRTSFVDSSLYAGILSTTLESKDIIKTSSVNKIDDSIIAGLMTGYLTANIDMSDFMIQSIEYLDKMKQTYNIDIRQRLSVSGNPVADLNAYMKELSDCIDQANLYYKKIQDLRADIKFNYDSVTVEKDKYEGLFFQNMKEFSAVGAKLNLNKFEELKNQQGTLKSEYKAWEVLENYYSKYIPAFQTRLKDIDYNQEALIKGVQVYELDKSPGIDLIIKVPNQSL